MDLSISQSLPYYKHINVILIYKHEQIYIKCGCLQNTYICICIIREKMASDLASERASERERESESEAVSQMVSNIANFGPEKRTNRTEKTMLFFHSDGLPKRTQLSGKACAARQPTPSRNHPTFTGCVHFMTLTVLYRDG